MCVFIKEELKAKEIIILSTMPDAEDLWVAVTLVTGLVINIRACFHLPKPIYNVINFKQRLQDNIGYVLERDSNSVFVFTGDLNRLSANDLQSLYGLDQIVNVPTHNNNILDKFITNRPDMFVVQVMQSLIKTKHKALIVNFKADCVQDVPRPGRTVVQLWDDTSAATCLL